MKKYYILTILLAHSGAHATDPLGQLLKKLDDPNNINCEEMTHDQLADHCARELCGPPGNKASGLTAKNVKKFMTPEIEKEFKVIEAEVARIYQQKTMETQKLINELEMRMKDPEFKNTSKWDNNDYSYFANFFWKYITWDVDSSKPLNERSQLKINESTVDRALLPGIREFAKEFNKNLYNDPIYAFESGVYDLEELKEKINLKAQKLAGDISSHKLKVGFNANSFSAKIKKLEDQDEIIAEFKKLDQLAKDNGLVLVASESYCQDQCKKSINHFVKNMGIPTIIENLKSTLKNNDQKDKIAECKANYISENHQNKLSKNFQKIWPEVKNAYHKNVLPRFSTHSQQMMKDYLENDIHFYFDNPSYKEFPDLKEMGKELKSSPDKQNNAFLLGDLTSNYFDHDINVFQSEIKICNAYSSPSLIWDSFMANENIMPMSPFQNPHYDTSKDNIAVSPFTCEHHREGSGILAHELGHAMSNLMNRKGMSEGSLKDYRTLRSCASKQWDVNANADHSYHPADKQFTEEDTADILSYLAVNDQKSLYACGFLDVDANESSYINFDTEPWGSHSPGLIRLMREATYKKSSIPQTCSFLMSKHQDKLGDKKCF